MQLLAGLQWAVPAAEVAIALPIAYLDAITISALVSRARQQQRAQGLESPDAPRTSFVFLIPAHNEELLLGRLLASLERQRYPRELYTVCVVADNCTDATAAIARGAGATVFERTDTSKRGKGFALSWLLEQTRTDGMFPDAYVVVDADSVVAPEFLQAMAREMARGARACQGSNTVLNAAEAPSTALRWLALTLVNYVRPLGRTGLGGSCKLSGNGMCFSRDLLERFPWRAFSIVEDYEYYLDIVAHGERVRYVPEAVVRAQIPTSFKELRTQDIRWEGGVPEASTVRVALRLLRTGVRSRSIVPLDAAAELLVPPLSTLMATLLLVVVAAAMLGTLAERGVAAALVAGIGLYLGSAFYLLRPGCSTYHALLYAPGYMAWKLCVQLVLRRTRRNRTEWVRTSRTLSTKQESLTHTTRQL